MLNPYEIKVDRDNRVSSVLFKRNIFNFENGDQKIFTTDEYVEIECQLVVKAIGYKYVPISVSIPSNSDHVQNIKGFVGDNV